MGRHPFDSPRPMPSPFASASRQPPASLRDASGFLAASAEVMYLEQVATGSTGVEVVIAELIDDQDEAVSE